MAIIHGGLLIGYYKIAVGSLYTRIVTRTLAQSRMHMLIEALEPMKGDIKIEQVRKILDEMLNLEDSETGIRFISGIKLEMDYEVIHAKEKTLDLKIGDTRGDNFIVPIYSKTTRELIGIAKFYSSQLSFKKSREKYSSLMLIGAITTLLLVITALWVTLTHLFTKIKGAEKKLQEKQAQLIHAGRLKAMGEMAAGIAHEINQPLQIIKLAAPYLDAHFKKTGPHSDGAEAAQDILKQVDRVTGIINNMRSFVRKKLDNLEYINLYEPLIKALSFFTVQFHLHQIDLHAPDKSLFENIPKVKINAQEFMQIVVNLLSNARDALDKKGEKVDREYQKKLNIHFSYEEDKKAVLFKVEDNGIGMTPEEKTRCMEPFYTTKEVGEGTGLGLSIVYNLARGYGMSITVESIEGEGTTFSILIPLKR